VYVGEQALRPNTGVVFRCDGLDSRVSHAPAVQTWVINDETPGMLGPVDRHGLWWLIAFGVDGTAPDLDARRLVTGAVGEDLPVEIVSTDPWVARMELVDRRRDGRVFLIGDAAHLNPPFGGHGLNTGVGDAVDLGWKLAATIDGWAGTGVLDSHESERAPLQRRVIDEAVANMSTLSPELLGGDLTAAGALGDEARARAAERIQATKSREFHSLDLVLGHRYEDSPILGPSPAEPGPWQSVATPGRRLPHVWLEPGKSTLDLVGCSHVLLTAADTDVTTIGSAAAERRMPLAVHRVHPKVIAGMGADWIVVRPDQVVAAVGTAARLVVPLFSRPNSPSQVRSGNDV